MDLVVTPYEVAAAGHVHAVFCGIRRKCWIYAIFLLLVLSGFDINSLVSLVPSLVLFSRVQLEQVTSLWSYELGTWLHRYELIDHIYVYLYVVWSYKYDRWCDISFSETRDTLVLLET